MCYELARTSRSYCLHKSLSFSTQSYKFIKKKKEKTPESLRMPTGTLARAFFSLVFDTVYCSEGRDNNLGKNYKWVDSLDAGLKEASKQKKPLMLVLHKSSCPACVKLKPKFATSNEIRSLSKQFIMVNLVDDELPEDAKYAPDGGYVPRILFISPDGIVDRRIYNKHASTEHKYFYSNADHIVTAMKKAIDIYGNHMDFS